MFNGKAAIFLLMFELIKKICHFPEPYTSSKNKIKV